MTRPMPPLCNGQHMTLSAPQSLRDRALDFDLETFLPYLLNQVAEATSHEFQTVYRDRYGMTRTQWRVLANLGKFGSMTARDICAISHIEKTKVSRAISALEGDQILTRTTSETDRRVEILVLTERGKTVFSDLGQMAIHYDAQLRARLGTAQAAQLEGLLRTLKAMVSPPLGSD